MKTTQILTCLFFGLLTVQAQLTVTVSSPKIIGQKAVVKLAMTNNLANQVESARAMCFLLNEQGKLVGESSRWVIGGTKERHALAPNQGTTFNFVVTSPQPFTTTNLTAKISFSRIVLAGGKFASPQKEVTIVSTKK